MITPDRKSRVDSPSTADITDWLTCLDHDSGLYLHKQSHQISTYHFLRFLIILFKLGVQLVESNPVSVPDAPTMCTSTQNSNGGNLSTDNDRSTKWYLLLRPL